MVGERDLDRLLEGLSPELNGRRFAFISTDRTQLADGDFALIRESQGVTAICERDDGEWALVSLGVHSSLDAVGLTAALSDGLARAGISANIVAGFHHDHIFVPWDARREALAAIQSLSSLSGGRDQS